MSEKIRSGYFTAHNVAYIAVLLALVIALQVIFTFFPVTGTSFSGVLIVLAFGAMAIGPACGAILGFAFGIVVIIMGLSGADGFTNYLLLNQPVLTVLGCLIKGVAAGFVPGIIYKVLNKFNKYAAVITACLSAPVANTGIFIVFALIMQGTIASWATSAGVEGGTVYVIFMVLAGINFLVEFLVNLIGAPILYTAERAIEKQIRRNK